MCDYPEVPKNSNVKIDESSLKEKDLSLKSASIQRSFFDWNRSNQINIKFVFTRFYYFFFKPFKDVILLV